MKAKLVLLLLTSVIAFSQSKSLNECANEDYAEILIGSHWVDVDAVQHTSLVRRVRLPEEGLYDDTITCLFATDCSIDDSGGDVEITDGGVGHRYAELRLNSKIGKPLDYLVMAYARRKSNIVNH